MLLQNELTTFARDSRGIDYFGVADLSEAKDFIREQSEGTLPRFPRAIAMGIVLQDSIVNLLPNRQNKAVQHVYRGHGYEMVNRRLDAVGSEIASMIQRSGFQAFPVSSVANIDGSKLSGIFSHKLAAHLSGLGWIGKSCLLVTPDHGPRVRWISVLTDAPLEPTGEALDDRCSDCMECVDICPVKAFTGRNFNAAEPREVRYQADKCDAYFNTLEAKGELRVCGMCLYVCPYGRTKGNS